MNIHNINSGRATSLPVALGFSLAMSMGTTILCSSLMAYLLEREEMTWKGAGYGIMITIIASSYIGAKVSWHRIKRQRNLVCILSGLLYYATLLLGTALFFGGQYEAMGVTFALIIAGCGSAGIVGHNANRGGRGSRIKRGVVKLYK